MNGLIDFAELTNHIRRIAAEVMGRSQFKGTLVCTGYDKTTHSVKGIIQPHGVESGWIPIAALHVGNGFGIVVGPRVGEPQKLDGQVFDLHFDGGDPDTLVAHHRQFSSVEKPPQVDPGEILVKHEDGSSVFFDKNHNTTITHGPTGNKMVFSQDKSITVTHHPSGSNIQIDPDGNQVHDPKDKQHIFKGVAMFQKDLQVAGNAALTSGTLGGVGIATV